MWIWQDVLIHVEKKLEMISRTTTIFLWPSHGTESLVLSIWGPEGCAGAGRPGGHPTIQVFQVAFAQALVLICLVPSFQGMQRRGTSLSHYLGAFQHLGEEGRGLGSLSGVRHGAGEGPPHLCSASHKPINRSLDFGGQLHFSIWAQETGDPAI